MGGIVFQYLPCSNGLEDFIRGDGLLCYLLLGMDGKVHCAALACTCMRVSTACASVTSTVCIGTDQGQEWRVCQATEKVGDARIRH
jgi:hypothetical protein